MKYLHKAIHGWKHRYWRKREAWPGFEGAREAYETYMLVRRQAELR